jgi:hypothetical protein
MKDGSTSAYPNVDKDFPKESLDYYEQRAGSTKNPVLKSRYLDVLIDLNNRYDLAAIAIESYMDSLKFYLEEQWDTETVDALSRSLEIALKVKNEELIKTVVENIINVADSWITGERPRFTFELLEDLIERYNRVAGFIEVDNLLSKIDYAIEFYRSSEKENSNLERSFLELKSNFYKTLKYQVKVDEVEREIYETYIRDAENVESQPMLER